MDVRRLDDRGAAVAGAGRARLIVIASPEGYQTRRIIELARKLSPTIDTAVRTSSESEVAQLEKQGIGIAIMGERELAFGLMEYALRSMGMQADAAHSIVQDVRVSGEGGAFERRPHAPKRGAPELRQHRDSEDDKELAAENS